MEIACIKRKEWVEDDMKLELHLTQLYAALHKINRVKGCHLRILPLHGNTTFFDMWANTP